LFQKGNVENAENSSTPTADQTFYLMMCRRSISPKDYVPGGNVSSEDL